MKISFCWDDGAVEDLKLFELHHKYNIPAIFFVPTSNIEGRRVISREDIRKNNDDIIKFGGHTEHHKYLTSIPIDEVKAEVVNNQQYLEDTIGYEIEHFCLPGGAYNNKILSIIFETYKTVRTASTMNFQNQGNICNPTFHMYKRGKHSLIGNAVRNFYISEGIFTILNSKLGYFDLIKKIIDHSKNKDYEIVLWGHSWEIEINNLWDEVDNIMRYLCNHHRELCVPYANLFNSK